MSWACGEASGPLQLGDTGDASSATISLSPGAVSFSFLGETHQLNATITDHSGGTTPLPPLTWLSLDPQIATVSSSGIVEATGAGTTTIIASAGAARPDSAVVTVEQRAEAVTITPDSVGLVAIGDTVTLRADVLDTGGSSIAHASASWHSADTLVVRVSPSGRLTSVALGFGFVSATSRAGGGLAASEALVLVYDSLHVTTTSLRNGIRGQSYDEVLEASGGDDIYRWSIASGRLPEGLALDSLGAITGTPTRLERASFTAEVVSAGQVAQRALSIGTCDLSFGECR
jgi:hypothetical protein